MERKWTHVMFAVAGIILAWLLAKCGDWAWSYFTNKPNQLIVGAGALLLGGAITFGAWRNEQVFGLASEVATELKKVTWPSRKETFTSTIIVIITTIVASMFLGLFDGVWSWVTRMIYG
jgi:preprotein translocase subunit SecE